MTNLFKTIFIMLISFLSGLIVLPGEIMPFGVAYFCALLYANQKKNKTKNIKEVKEKDIFSVFPSVPSGFFITFGTVLIGKNGLSDFIQIVIALTIVYIWFGYNDKADIKSVSSILLLVVFLSGLPSLVQYGFLLFDIIRLLLKCIISLLAFLIITKIKILTYVPTEFKIKALIKDIKYDVVSPGLATSAISANVYGSVFRNILNGRLSAFSDALSGVAKAYEELANSVTLPEISGSSTIFDRTAERICKDCSMCLLCWERNFYDTYQVMQKITEIIENKGHLVIYDVPVYFKDRCIRINEFVETFNIMNELSRMESLWKNKLKESRELVAAQIRGISSAISDIASDICEDSGRILYRQSKEIMRALVINNIGVKDLTLIEDGRGRYELTVFLNSCKGKSVCSEVEKYSSMLLGKKMSRYNDDCCIDARKGGCSIRFVEAENLRIAIGVCLYYSSEKGVSGDSHAAVKGRDGKFYIALSDGMGSGKKAASYSKAAIEMLENLVASGLDGNDAINLVNSSLVIQSEEDCYCTMDISIVNLLSGETEFVKTGAAPTFVKRGDKIEKVKNASLPAGIFADIKFDNIKKNLYEGDIILMMSDGAYEPLRNAENGDEELSNILMESEWLNPQRLADRLLQTSKANLNSDADAEDDMLILAARIWKP